MVNLKIFFLDFIKLNIDINDAPLLAGKINKSLKSYDLTGYDILTCATDNCNLMNLTAELLDIWKIPCILHLFNLIFEVFIDSI